MLSVWFLSVSYRDMTSQDVLGEECGQGARKGGQRWWERESKMTLSIANEALLAVVLLNEVLMHT